MLSAREIAERLTDAAEDVARELLPAGKRQGNEWHSSASRSPLGYAVAVVTKGAKQGVVLFTGGTSRGKQGGDLLDLASEIYGSKRSGIEWAKSYLGLSDERPELSEAQKAAAERRRKERERADAKAAERKQARALDIWRRAVPISGTPAEVYLRKRGIADNAWPPSLRYAEAIEWELGRTQNPQGLWTSGPVASALVGAVQDARRDIVAIWRVFITKEGDKAALNPCKCGLGPAKGGAVRFGPAQETIGVAEGIETTLALRELLGDSLPMWATLSTSGMAALELPDGVREVRIFPDSDLEQAGKPAPGIRAAETLAERLRARKVRAIIEPAPQVPKTDFLDTLRSCNARG
jgi:putative DNA primase/helicase